MLWTRYVSGGGEARLTAEVSRTPDFRRSVGASVVEDDHFEFDVLRCENGTHAGFDAEFFVPRGDEDGQT